MRAAAFFDIDHTLISADSGVLFVRYLVNRGLMTWTELLGPARRGWTVIDVEH